MIKKFMILIVMITLVGTGCALTLKANIGVGAWDAFSATLANISSIEVGTISVITNGLCILVQIVILRKDFKRMQLLQIPLSLLLGNVINFMLYDVLGHITIDSYQMRVVFFVLGIVIVAFAVGVVMLINIVAFPLEGMCMAISKKIEKKFHVIRQIADVVTIIVVLVLTAILTDFLAIREGTIISMLLFGPLMGIIMKVLTPYFKKNKLIHAD